MPNPSLGEHPGDTVAMTLRLHRHTVARVRMLAGQRGVTVAELLRRAVEAEYGAAPMAVMPQDLSTR